MKKIILWMVLIGCSIAAYANKSNTLRVGMATLTISTALDERTRETGLMFRETIGANEGMLFAFPVEEKYCMWMKNTKVPLSVAFLDATGKIINIEHMRPETETAHCAIQPVRYALEVPKGWFQLHGIRPGVHIPGVLKYKAID